MTDPDNRTAAFARTDVDLPDFGGLSLRLGRMLEEQVTALELDAPADSFSEARVKALLLLARTLQAMEDMVQKQEKAKNEQAEGPDDILEFRAELARRLEALGAGWEGGSLPGETDAAPDAAAGP